MQCNEAEKNVVRLVYCNVVEVQLWLELYFVVVVVVVKDVDEDVAEVSLVNHRYTCS